MEHSSSLRLAVGIALFGCRAPIEPAPEPIEPYDPLEWVDPFIGTGGLGAQVASVTPGASRPFGMVLVGPDTSAAYGAPGFYHCAGYHWPDTHVMGFSHTHGHGLGITDFGAIQVMPADGWDPAKADPRVRELPFDHAREWASPGWYAVELDGGRIAVEIAATERGAAHRYRFADGADPVLIVDLGFSLGTDRVEAGEIHWDAASGELSGVQNLHGGYSARFGGLLTHFAGRVEPAPIGFGTWADGAHGDEASVDGQHVGLWLRFPPGTVDVALDLAVSYVDVDGARGNLASELPRFDLDAVRAEAADAWRAELAGVRARGADRDLRIFHTAQYHAMLMPSLHQDVDGRYRGVDGAIHTADEDVYTDFSLWDTFRTQHPWLLLTRPERQRAMMRSLLRMTRDGGWLPRWPMAHGYTGGMVGNPAVQVLAESALKGLGGFDEAFALDVSIRAALDGQDVAGRSGHAAYLDLGYVSFESSGNPASRTLEYAWTDHALSRWADAAGRPESARLAELGATWRHTFDPAQGWIVGRYADGSFDTVRNPAIWTDSYTEGNAWHYRWGAFWDPDGIVAHTHGGSVDDALGELAAFWDAVEAEPDDDLPDDHYWHGNEPVLHYAMIPALLGDSALTTRAVRLVRETRYDDTPEGLDGNDDAGTLSSWYLWQAVGLYPIAGTVDYAIGEAGFDRVEIDLEGGRSLVVDREHGAPRAGRLTHAELIDGTVWRF